MGREGREGSEGARRRQGDLRRVCVRVYSNENHSM